MRVRDIMTTKVFTIGADKKAFVAKEIMEWAHVRHIPVVDSSNRVVGILCTTPPARLSPTRRFRKRRA